MDCNKPSEIIDNPSRFIQGITEPIVNIDLPINYDTIIDGDEQPDDVEIATLIISSNF